MKRCRLIAVAVALATMARVAVAQCSPGLFHCGDHFTVRLENPNCHFSDGTGYFTYRVDGVAGQTIDVFAASGFFQPGISLYQGNGSYPITTTTGYPTAELLFKIPASGTYWIAIYAYYVGPQFGAIDVGFVCPASCARPILTTPFQSYELPFGGTTSFAISVDGTPPFHFRWFDADYPNVTLGSDSQIYATGPITKTTAFHAQISNPCGSGDFFVALITVPACAGPAITQQPQSAKIYYDAQVSFSVAASGMAPLSYQWYEDWPDPVTPIGGAIGSSLTIGGTTTTRHFWVKVTNQCGTVESDHAAVTIKQSPKRRSVKRR